MAADVEVEDDLLTSVAVSGDFFLEPDDALEAINDALTGLPAAADVATYVSAIEAATPGVRFIGFSPEAVGIAIRRALGHATSWSDHTFDIIHSTPRHPAMHVALDEVLAGELAAGRRGPTLVFWEWDAPWS